MKLTRDALREKLPFYLLVVFVFCFAVWSLVLPKLFHFGQDAIAVTFSTASNAVVANNASNHELLFNSASQKYHLFYTSSTGASYGLYMASSTDAQEWGTSRILIDTDVRVTSSLQVLYHDGASLFAATYFNDSFVPVFATSSDGVAWTTSTIVGNNAEFRKRIGLAASTTSGFTAVFLQDSTNNNILITTSTQGSPGTWTATSTVFETYVSDGDTSIIGAKMDSVGVLHLAAYLIDSTDGAPNGEVVYASSSDQGTSWTTTSIDIGLSVNMGGGNYLSLDQMSALNVDSTDLPGILYTRVDSGSMDDNRSTSTLLFAKKDSNGAWATSSIKTQMGKTMSMSQNQSTEPGFIFEGYATALIGYTQADNDTQPYFAHNDGGAFAEFQIDAGASQYYQSGNIGVAYNDIPVTDIVAYSFIDSSGNIKVSTSTFEVSNLPIAPTAAQIDEDNITQTSVKIDWTHSGSDEDGFVVEYSTDNSNWSEGVLPAVDAITGTVTGLTANTEYYFRVAAYNTTGTSTYSTAGPIHTFGSNTIRSVEKTSLHDLLYVNGVYSLFYADILQGASEFDINVVTSSDAETWSTPVVVLNNIKSAGTNSDVFDVAYSTTTGYYGVLAKNTTDQTKFVTSSNIDTWGTPINVVSDAISQGSVHLTFSTSSDMGVATWYSAAVDEYVLATTTAGGDTWTTSTIAAGLVGGDPTNIMVGSGVTGASGSEVIHAVYSQIDGGDGDPLGDLYYASSSDYGATWTTNRLASSLGISAGGGIYSDFSDMIDFHIDDKGYLGLIYYEIDDMTNVSGNIYSVTTTMVVATSSLGITWSSTTIDTLNGQKDLNPFRMLTPDIRMFGTGYPVFTYYNWENSYPTIGYVTTSISTTSLESVAISQDTNFSLLYDTVDEWGVSSYVYGSNLNITTTSVPVPASVSIPNSPTAVVTSTLTSTTVLLSWTDNATDETGFLVEYSTDNSNWTLFETTGADEVTSSITGLEMNRGYYFRVAATNSAGNSAYTSANGITYTLVNKPGQPTIGSPTETTLPITIDVNSNTSTAKYAIYNVTDSNYLDATGASSVSAVYNTTSTLGLNFAATGLTPNKQYEFYVIAQNAQGVTTAQSATSATTYTLANTPGTPTIGTPTVSTLPITIAENSNSAETTYAIYNETDGVYIKADGTANGAASVYQTKATWASIAAAGLSPNTVYQFKVYAKNGNDVETSASALSAATYTLANTPGTPTIGTPTVSTLPITIDENSNPSNTTYAVYNSTDGNYLDANGASSETAVYSTTATLGPNFEATGLSVNTAYQFEVFARNGDGVDSEVSLASGAKYTLANTPGTPTIGTPTVSTLPITIAENSNPAATTYAIYNETDGVYIKADGTANGATSVYQTKATWASIAAAGLSPDTSYQFKIYAKNGDGLATTASGLSTAKYTLANVAGTPTIGTPTVSTLPITIDENGNPPNTTYAVYNSNDGNYLDANGESSNSAVYNTTSTLGSSFAATGLSPNTAYQFEVFARNGDDVDAEVSVASAATYTAANVPTSLSATEGNQQLSLTWSGDATAYAIQNITEGTVTDWAAETSATITGLACHSSYTFKIKGRNGDSVETAYSSTIGATTVPCNNSTDGAPSGGVINTPTLPSKNTTDPKTETSENTIAIGQMIETMINGVIHTIKVLDASTDMVKLEIRSNPIVVTIDQGTTKKIDVDGDFIFDTQITYVGLKSGKPEIVVDEITENKEKAVLINNGAAQTTDRSVVLSFGVDDASHVAISERDDFADAVFEKYTQEKSWMLSDETGLKTIYVRFRNTGGGTVDSFGTITLVKPISKKTVKEITKESIEKKKQEQAVLLEDNKEAKNNNTKEDAVNVNKQPKKISVNLTTCPLQKGVPYKTLQNNAVYYITDICTKRPFDKPAKYYSYFDAWSDISVTTQSMLDSIMVDVRGFMPYGPKYSPKQIAIVKSETAYTDDILLVSNDKTWTISTAMMRSLGFLLSWIEEIDRSLLQKLSFQGELVDHTTHPDDTLVKYINSPKVYIIQEGKKRHIVDMKAFNKNGYRLDRIITISETETYPDAEPIY